MFFCRVLLGMAVLVIALLGLPRVIEAAPESEPRLTVQAGNIAPQWAVFSPDGSRVLSGGYPPVLWDVASGREIRRFGLSDFFSTRAAFSPDGRRLATTALGMLNLWSIESGRELRQVAGHRESASSIAFFPDGSRFASCSKNGPIRIRDSDSGRELFRLDEHDALREVAVSSDARWLWGQARDGARLWDLESLCIDCATDGESYLVGGRSGTVRLHDRATGETRVRMQGHRGAVRAVAFSYDGGHAASGGDDATARVWDPRTGIELRRFQGHRGAVETVALSRDGTRLATGGQDRTVRVWDVDTGKELSCLGPLSRRVLRVTFDADPRRVHVDSGRGIRTWDTESGSLDGLDRTFDAIVCSPDGRTILTGGADGVARLWDASTGKQLRSFKGHTRAIRNVAFDARGRTIATSAADGTVRLWDATSGKGLRSIKCEGAELKALAGRWLLTTNDDDKTTVWDTRSGAEVRQFPGCSKARLSEDGRILCALYAAPSPGRVVVWDVKTGKRLQTWRGPSKSSRVDIGDLAADGRHLVIKNSRATGVIVGLLSVATGQTVWTARGLRDYALSPSGKHLLGVDGEGVTRLHELEGYEEVRRFGRSQRAQFSADGRWIATDSTSAVQLWETETGRRMETLPGIELLSIASLSADRRWLTTWDVTPDSRLHFVDVANATEIGRIDQRSVTCSAVSRDGRWILEGGPDRAAVLREAATGRRTRSFLHEDSVRCVALSPDGRSALTRTRGQSFVWDTASGRVLRQFAEIALETPPVLSARGEWMLALDRAVRIRNLQSGKLASRFEAHAQHGVTFSTNGRWVATVNSEELDTVRLWDRTTGQEVQRLRGHEGTVNSLEFSPDGSLLLTACIKGPVRLWQVRTGKELRRLEGHAISAAFSPDGRWLLTRHGQMSAGLWDAATGDEVRRIPNVESIVFSPDGKHVLITKYTDAPWESVGIELWTISSGTKVRQFEGAVSRTAGTALALSPDGQLLVAGGLEDGIVHVWDLTTGRPRRRIAHGTTVFSTAIDRSGRSLATGGMKDVRVWDLVTGRERCRLGPHDDGVASMSFSPLAPLLLTCDGDGRVRVWDARTGKLIREVGEFYTGGWLNFFPHAFGAFLPDGGHVLLHPITLDSGPTQVWNWGTIWTLGTPRKMQELDGTPRGFSRNGRWALDWHHEQLRLWDVCRSKVRKQYPFDACGLISPDGTKMFTLDRLDFDDERFTIEEPVFSLRATSTGEANWTVGLRELVPSALPVFAPDGRRIYIADLDGAIRLVDTRSGNELCELISFRDGTWAVLDAHGHYDAPQGGRIRGLHWVRDGRTLALDKVPGRYRKGLLRECLADR